ncbi:hypothetical protein L9F63_021606 [Diploptera punctata]|uniref:tRNA(Phe) (4-demethylwyosine(37)-C(7)) aminocarboxypropyltransferase n=1 Tax=Diploptera punctata TaxID=6984 RepID=A0AAD7ZNL2_DIPPU|nr:hypothetical protein L9F63_021606 [Diploptera punctata]
MNEQNEEYDKFTEELERVQDAMKKADFSLGQVSGWDDDAQGIDDDRNPCDSPQREILTAAENGDLAQIANLISSDPTVLHALDKDGYTPLHRACYNNHEVVVDLLLKHGANISAETEDGWQPLHSACKWNNTQCAAKLLEHGADPNATSKGDSECMVSFENKFKEKKKVKKVMTTYLKLKENIEHMMQSKGLWHDSLVVEIPCKWEKYGDTVLIDKDRYLKNSVWKQAGSELWTCICASLGLRRVALKGHIYPDGYRTPNCELVWGDSNWIECQDNGIKFSWNITKSMFSAGNASERHRVATFNCEDEVIVDLYAGIGYFTLPYLIHAKACLVHACEWNPYAVEAIRKNLVLNNVTDRCIVHPGDNQMSGLNDIADRVNCGLLPSSRCGWELACKVLKTSSGGVLHLHENVTSGIFHKNMEKRVPKDRRPSNMMEENCNDDRNICSVKTNYIKCLENTPYETVENLILKGDNTIKNIGNITEGAYYSNVKDESSINDPCKNIDEKNSFSEDENINFQRNEYCKKIKNVNHECSDICKKAPNLVSECDTCKCTENRTKSRIYGTCKSGNGEGSNCKNVTSCVLKDNSCRKINRVVYTDVSNKKEEWKLWSESAARDIQHILQKVKGGNWEVRILKLNHVKSYAPHVDHLVLDLFCSPALVS